MNSGASTWKMSLEELVAGAEGKVLSQKERVFTGVGTDTRADLTGKIFVALKGDTFDAHDFLAQAVDAGAAALIVHRLPETEKARAILDRATVVVVDDTLRALQDLGNFWRHKMKARILGVTGTNGKTTTKEFTAAVLGSKFNVQYSKGSFNNHWGVPISLLSIDPTHEIAVIEMGMNHPGELTVLSRIAEPDVVMVTMVGRGHLEGVGSIEGVARAKAEIYEHAPKNAVRVFNLENEHTRAMHEKWGKDLPADKVITFAGVDFARAQGLLKEPAGAGRAAAESSVAAAPAPLSSAAAWPAVDVALEVVSAGPDSLHIAGEIRGVPGETTVPVFGRHNITNLMAAASFALASGMSPAEIWKALPLSRTAWGRNQWVNLESGARVLFDAYNANPESMKAAVENFAGLSAPSGGRKIGVFGEMRELGTSAPDLHRELGESVARAGFDAVCFLGPSREAFSAGLKAAGFQKSLFISDSYENNLAPRMLPVLDRNDIVLIKGSRGMQLEKVLSDLKPLDFQTKK